MNHVHVLIIGAALSSRNTCSDLLERGALIYQKARTVQSEYTDDGIKAECVITKETNGIYELKNIAVLPECQRKGYGKSLIEYLFAHYSDCNVMLVGTGDCPSALSFYTNCGFKESHRIKNFFIDNYNHPMFEDDIQLVDMVYLKKERNI